MLPGIDDAEIREEVLVRTRRAYLPAPDLRVIERPGWFQLITPSMRDGGMNEVCLAVLDAAEVDEVIDRTIAEYRALGIRFRWSVGPDSRPADLAERLARRGLRSSVTCAMASRTDAARDGVPDGVRVEEVDARSVDLFTRVMAEGWSMDPGPLHRLHEALLADPHRRQRLQLAYHRGAPAAVAAHVVFPRSAYLLGAVVLPAFRGRGLYRALVQWRLRDAAARGLPLATSLANESTSAPILARMGFVTVCRYPLFHG